MTFQAALHNPISVPSAFPQVHIANSSSSDSEVYKDSYPCLDVLLRPIEAIFIPESMVQALVCCMFV